jgi:hypothetical protein
VKRVNRDDEAINEIEAAATVFLNEVDETVERLLKLYAMELEAA